MKKSCLALILAILMIFSSLQISALTTVGVESSAELSETEADVAALFADLTLSGKTGIPAKGYNNNVSTPGTTTITASEEVDWSFTYDGLSESQVTLSTTATTATVTAKRYAGEVTLTATSKTDSAKTAQTTVHIYGNIADVPGHDIITGTSRPLDFEDFTVEDCGNGAVFFTNNVSVVDNPSPDEVNGNGKVLSFNADRAYIFSTYQSSLIIEKTRPVLVSYLYNSAREGTAGTYTFWFLVNTDIPSTINNSIYADKSVISNGVWKRDSYVLNGATDVKNSLFSGTSASTLASTGFIKFGFDARSLVGTYKGHIYLDDLSIIPFYKVTYYNFDNTVASTEYILTDDDGNLLTSFVPDKTKVPGCTGYALTKDGAKVLSVPLSGADISLYPVTTSDVTFNVGTESLILNPSSTEDFTFPTPSSLGFTDTDFIGWYDEGSHFFAGNTVSFDTVSGKEYTAFYQDVTKPAMGFAYEGDKSAPVTDRIKSYSVENDVFRNVIHYKHYLRYSTYSHKFLSDARTAFKSDTAVDANEYSIVQYCYRVDNMKTTDASGYDAATGIDTEPKNPSYTDVYSATMRMGYYCYKDINYNLENLVPGTGANVLYPIKDGYMNVINNGKYNVYEFDMTKPENNASVAWNETGEIWGFWMEPCNVNYSADSFVDYVRIYRKGILTVNYDINLPEDCDASNAIGVEPDLNRGAGTGYLLKGDAPVLGYNDVDFYVFKGWGLTPDATETVSSIDLTKDTTVYAVWMLSFPETQNVSSIRLSSPTGIRFMASVDNEQREVCTEYGFIVARKTALSAASVDNYGLTFDCGVTSVSGKSYCKEDSTDKIFDTDGTNIFFTGVLYGIPKGYEKEALVGRPYIKIGGTYYYGDPVERSIYNVASDVKNDADAYNALTSEQKAIIDGILA